MKEMCLTVQRPTELGHYKKPLPRRYFKNQLNNQYSQIAPNSVWVSDIAYVRIGNEYKFVCVVIDLSSRRSFRMRFQSVSIQCRQSELFLKHIGQGEIQKICCFIATKAFNILAMLSSPS